MASAQANGALEQAIRQLTAAFNAAGHVLPWSLLKLHQLLAALLANHLHE